MPRRFRLADVALGIVLGVGLAVKWNFLAFFVLPFLLPGRERNRALLVSHWAVDSEAATRLTISTFELLKNEPKIGRAEALRRAMLTFVDDATSPRNAYPAMWGPFALIGEGKVR